MKKIMMMLANLLVLTGCMDKLPSLHNKEEVVLATNIAVSTNRSQRAGSAKDESAVPLPSGEPNTIDLQPTATQIIRNGNIEFQVKELSASHKIIADILAANNAYFDIDNTATDNDRLNANMVIRIPAQNFDKVMAAILNESIYTNYKNITAEDVTAEFIDTESRLKTKRAVEERYLALLKQAGKVSDMLEVEAKLGDVREQIEATEGKLKLMKSQVAFSTVRLDIYQKLDYTPVPEIGFVSHLKEGFVIGWRNLLGFFLVLVNIWPFAIFAGAMLFWFIRRRKKVKP